MTKLRVNSIVKKSLVDGPGERAVLFVQGCTLKCKGCQSRHTWPKTGGEERWVVALARELLAANRERVTISGGEPMQQMDGLAALLKALKALEPDVHVIVYTGYRWQELFAESRGKKADMNRLWEVLEHVDVIVDGRFELAQDDDLMQWRGSANQRPIDVAATFFGAKEHVSYYTFAGHSPTPKVLDWSTPEIVVSLDGKLIVPVGQGLVDDLGQASASRRCGESR